MKQKIGIIGSGNVAKTLGQGFLKHGYEVKMGTSHSDKLNEWLSNDGKGAFIGTFQDAADFGQILVLAIKGTTAELVMRSLNSKSLTGKTIIDTTNPIADAVPENGVLKYFTSLEESLLELLQKATPEAHYVKAFNIIGSAFMVNPVFKEKPTMFICGNSNEAKTEVTTILDIFGFEIEDMGAMEAARAIEPLCMLWCIPGFRENRWTHAFRLIKM